MMMQQEIFAAGGEHVLVSIGAKAGGNGWQERLILQIGAVQCTQFHEPSEADGAPDAVDVLFVDRKIAG